MEVQPGLSSEQKHRLILTNDLKASLEILTLPIGDILLILEEECQENPFIEISEKNLINPRTDFAEGYISDWDGSGYNSLDWLPAPKDSFFSFIDFQAREMFSGISYTIAQDIVSNLSGLGFLEVLPEDIAKKNKVSIEQVDKIRNEFMSLEGLGIGALNYQEYIVYLLTSDPEGMVAKNEIENYLSLAVSDPERARKEYEQIHKKIKSLPPYPSYGFGDVQEKGILVDAIIFPQEDRFEVEIINEPEISFLNSEYIQLIKLSDDTARKFLNDKLKRAKILIRAIKKRSETLKRVIRFIAEKQKSFLTGISNFPVSLTEQEIAKELKVHQTTVSRAIKSKIIKTPIGFVSLKSLLTPASFKGDRTRSQILHEVRYLFKHFPEMNDKQISNYLKENKGIEIARRTISKYRKLLGFSKK